MKLSNDLIRGAIFGAIEVWEENRILKMSRFTRKQRKYFEELKEDIIDKSLKARASANMLVDFYTDSTSLKISADCVVASGQSACWFDVYVDGSMKEHFGYTVRENRSITFSMKLAHGKKRITIYLPYLFGVGITELSIDDGALFEPAVRDRKIMFFGDSITQGYISEYPSLTYTGIIANALNAECVNQGIAAGVFDENDLDVTFPFQPDTIFVAYGTNDWSSKRDLEEYAVKYMDRLTNIYPEAKIYMLLPIWRTNIEEKIRVNHIVLSFDRMHQQLRDIGKRYKNVEVIDGMELVPHSESMFTPDGTHPNEIGFIMYGTELLKYVIK